MGGVKTCSSVVCVGVSEAEVNVGGGKCDRGPATGEKGTDFGRKGKIVGKGRRGRIVGKEEKERKFGEKKRKKKPTK